jgi:hypothetical protein
MKSKKVFVILGTLLFATSFTGTAAISGTTSDTGPGCGLGKVAWEGSGADPQAIGPQLLMSTTNNTILPWQAFGITTGIFGCENNGKLWAEKKTFMFANANFEDISQEMAQGYGEHLISFATLMGIPEEQHQEFLSLTQQKYATLLQNGESSPVAIIKTLNDFVSTNPLFAQVSK